MRPAGGELRRDEKKSMKRNDQKCKLWGAEDVDEFGLGACVVNGDGGSRDTRNRLQKVQGVS